MAYTFSFCDNESYAAKDVNAITARVVTSGVAEVFSDGVASSVSKFNELGAQLYSDGVVGATADSLRVTKTAEGKLYIAPGVAFFADGAVFEVLEGGHVLDLVAGCVCYVYLKNDLDGENVCYPVCDTEAPEGDFVLLAMVEEDGTVVDKRVFAKGKLPGYEAPTIAGLCIKEDLAMANGETITKVYDVGNGRITHVMAVQFERNCLCNVWRKDGVVISNGEQYDNNSIMIYREAIAYALATFSLADGQLTMHIRYINHAEKPGKYPVSFELHLF